MRTQLGKSGTTEPTTENNTRSNNFFGNKRRRDGKTTTLGEDTECEIRLQIQRRKHRQPGDFIYREVVQKKIKVS